MPSSVPEAVDRARALLARPGRSILGIAGAPGAGKSTLAATVAEALGPAAVLVPMDGFHLADQALDALGRRAWKGRIDTFDGRGYLALLRRLRLETDHVVYAPAFERELEQPLAGAIGVGPECRLVITEGNYLLCEGDPWAEVLAELDDAWFCEVDDDLRTARLVERHVRFGKPPDAAVEWVRRVDGPNAELVTATRHRAHVVVRP